MEKGKGRAREGRWDKRGGKKRKGQKGKGEGEGDEAPKWKFLVTPLSRSNNNNSQCPSAALYQAPTTSVTDLYSPTKVGDLMSAGYTFSLDRLIETTSERPSMYELLNNTWRHVLWASGPPVYQSTVSLRLPVSPSTHLCHCPFASCSLIDACVCKTRTRHVTSCIPTEMIDITQLQQHHRGVVALWQFGSGSG